MKAKITNGVPVRLPLRGMFLLAAAIFLCFTTGTGSVGAQPVDDHGDTLSTATALTLDSSVAGRIDPGNDPDLFRLDLSGRTGNIHVWVYTTGSLDTLGGLYDSSGERISINDNTLTLGGAIVDTNFRVRQTLPPGVYYVGVFSAGRTTTGAYTLHVTSDDHSHFLDAATPLALDFSVAGRINPGFDGDAFKLDLSGAAGNTHVWIYTTGDLDTWGRLYDTNGDLITGNDDTTLGDEIVSTNFRIPRTLAPEVYYIWVLSADLATAGDYTLHVVTDDHGHYFDTATFLALGASATGRIDPGFDRDRFKLDLSGASGITDVWIYTTGDIDTRGWLYDSTGNLYLVFNNDSYITGRERNFHIRRTLPRGIYYISVQSWRNEGSEFPTGEYTLHAEAVTRPGNSTATAAALNLDSPTPGVVDHAGDADYFSLALDESRNLVIYALGLALQDEFGLIPVEPLEGTVIGSDGRDIPVNVRLMTFNGNRFGFLIEDDFEPGTYHVKVTAPDRETTYPVPYTIHAYEDTDYTKFVEDCEAATAGLENAEIGDSLYGCQWHLENRAEGGEDINVEAIWAEGINGEGVNVVVVDDTIDHSHEDLSDNFNSSLSHDYGGRGSGFRPYEHHGTAVAGIIAARDNGAGVRGVAPRATIYGYNFLHIAARQPLFEDINRADAMGRNRAVTAVSNNSWGPVDNPGLGEANRLWELAIDAGIRSGYDGKGVFYAFAGGNGGRGHRVAPDGTVLGGHFNNVRGRGDDANLDEIANYYGVTAVCAVNDQDARAVYSEKGANLWVCAPSGETELRGIVTTENSNRYRDGFDGTSASTPMVAGIAALLRQANPSLTWRDLKLILAGSARKNDGENPGWADGALKYGADSVGGRYQFNHEYGFGLVDAKAAVDLARGWSNVPPMETASKASSAPVTIPPPTNSGPQTVTTKLTVDTDIRFTEFVEVNADFRHTSFRDMEIELVSPSGAVSKLAVPFNTRHYTATYRLPDGSLLDDTYYVRLDGEFRFGSARHLGEDPNGEWTLRLADHYQGIEGTLRSWSIKVYGHAPKLGPPNFIGPITSGPNSLGLTWRAPGDDGGAAIAAYDIRYIETSSKDKVDANWTMLEKVKTTGTGLLQFIITGLSDGLQYDVQVRAVSTAGPGEWSASASGTPDPSGIIPPLGSPVFEEGRETTRPVKEGAVAGDNVGDLVTATDPDYDTLTYALGGADESSFNVGVSTGQITLAPGTVLDYEAKGSYKVSVTAIDPSGYSAAIEVTIAVVDERLGEAGSRYDTNNNRVLEKGEVLAAVSDYFRGLISKTEILTLVRLYFASR